jgi:hypothetical protein
VSGHIELEVGKHPWRWLIAAAFLVTLVLGIYGYASLFWDEYSGLLLWLNVFYKSIGLFFHGGEVGEPGIVLAVARTMAIIVTTWAVGWTALLLVHRQARHWILVARAKNHYVICGLGDRGFALAQDLLEKKKEKGRVVAIELGSEHPNVERLRKLGGAVVIGDARDAQTLLNAAMARASDLILLTGSDATNLEVLNVAKRKFAHKGLRCHVHLANRENHVLFEVGGRYFPPVQNGMEISLISLHESAAQKLFQDHLPGANIDTRTLGARPVRILINGFGGMGEAALIEIMLMGHFCNHEPVEITVLDEHADAVKREFFHRYWQAAENLANNPTGKKGLALWRLEFVDSLECAGSLDRYSDILACHDLEDEALVAIHNLWQRHRCAGGGCTRFFVHAPSGRALANSGIQPFGSKQEVCSKEFVIDKELERFSRVTHEIYARKRLEVLANQEPAIKEIIDRLHDENKSRRISLNQALKEHDALKAKLPGPPPFLAWENLSLFLKGSNKAEIRHMGIKLHALGLRIAKSSAGPPEAERQVNADVAGYPWPMIERLEGMDKLFSRTDANLLLAMAKQSRGLTDEELSARIDALAEAEHNRWNAYLVMNNFRYAERKDESHHAHDCLLSWQELKKRKPDMPVYDYKNVYQLEHVLKSHHRWAEPLSKDG